MSIQLADIYTDYLIAQNKHATATGLSDLLAGEISHDQVTRLLHKPESGSKELWLSVKKDVRSLESKDEGFLLLDDMVAEKPYTDENAIISWHYSHAKNRVLKGINLLTMMVRYGEVSLPIGYDVIEKDLRFSEIKTKEIKRKSSVSKNELFRQLITKAYDNQLKFRYIMADSWFSSKENMNYIHNVLGKEFIFGVKSNRSIAMTRDDKIKGCYQQLNSALLEDGVPQTVYLKDIKFPVQIMKKVFKNEDGSSGTLYLATNNLSIDGEQLLHLYKKRWGIEEYHKSIKQNSSFEKSPTRTVRSQINHIFYSILSFCKLERLKWKTSLNHFAIKYKLILKANQAAMQELAIMTG